MEPMNINWIGGNTANFKLRGTPVRLSSKMSVGVRPDGDGYEQVWEEVDLFEKSKTQMRLRGTRKQKAARAMIPLATVKKVEIGEPAPKPVVMARLTGDERDVKIAELEAKIKALLGVK